MGGGPELVGKHKFLAILLQQKADCGMMVQEKSSADILGLNVKRKRTDAGWADRQGEHGLLDQVTLAITFLLRDFVPDDRKCSLSLCGRGEASRKEDARPGK